MMLDWFARKGGLVIALAVIACGPAISVDGDETDGSGGDTDVTTTASTSVGTSASTSVGTSVGTTDPVTTDPVTTDPATTDPATTDPVTTDATVGDVTTDPTGGGLPNGSTCESGFDCASGECYVLGILGGICGQCDEDSDCDGGGCSLPNPLASPPVPSACNDGSYGDSCESDTVCADELLCGLVLDVPGVLQVSTCGECESQIDCAPGFTCEPDVAVAALAGVMRCVANGTLANGQSCDHLGSGDDACGSGFCAPADIMGVLQVGVCSACEIDGDCPSGTCAPPQIDLDSGIATPGACEP